MRRKLKCTRRKACTGTKKGGRLRNRILIRPTRCSGATEYYPVRERRCTEKIIEAFQVGAFVNDQTTRADNDAEMLVEIHLAAGKAL